MKTMIIRIIETPPGQAPESIREQWIGLELPIQEEKDDGRGLRDGTANSGGYKVLASDAISALREAGKEEAANYWEGLLGATILVFRTDCCEEV